MSWLNKLEAKYGRWAIANLTVILIAGQVLLFCIQLVRASQAIEQDPLANLYLAPGLVMQGEVWRLVTFLFIPGFASPIWMFFYCYLFYLFGTSLENQWGVFRYNIFLGIGYLANVGAVFVAWTLGSDLIADNGFLYGTIFLAFARLYPHFVLHIFFILPIQIKWLALLAWIGYGYAFLVGSGMSRMMIVASLLNYFLFFGREHIRDVKAKHRRRAFEARTKAATKKALHKCLVCGLDSDESPQTLFRYCSKCEGQACYCPEHIHDHECIRTEAEVDSG